MVQEESSIPTLGGIDHESNLLPEALKKILQGADSETDLEQMIESMVQQLMTKDIMYEPMREACEKVGDEIVQKIRSTFSAEFGVGMRGVGGIECASGVKAK